MTALNSCSVDRGGPRCFLVFVAAFGPIRCDILHLLRQRQGQCTGPHPHLARCQVEPCDTDGAHGNQGRLQSTRNREAEARSDARADERPNDLPECKGGGEEPTQPKSQRADAPGTTQPSNTRHTTSGRGKPSQRDPTASQHDPPASKNTNQTTTDQPRTRQARQGGRDREREGEREREGGLTTSSFLLSI